MVKGTKRFIIYLFLVSLLAPKPFLAPISLVKVWRRFLMQTPRYENNETCWGAAAAQSLLIPLHDEGW